MIVTTLVDNEVWRRSLASTWGISFYVEAFTGEGRHAILMDTSGSFDSLSKNVSKLHVDLSDLEGIFISHWHGDHCGCLDRVLQLVGQPVPVYIPSESFLGSGRISRAGGISQVCSEPTELCGGIMMSTGRMGRWTREHSLLINMRNRGLIILTGCSHPGIIDIAKRAVQITGTKIYAVIGGLHISRLREGENVARLLKDMGVELVSPCHCTGSSAKAGIARVMGSGYLPNGSGKTISIS